MKSRRYYISGKVQGVYYRKNIQGMASAAKLSGFVRNLADGRVEACVTCADGACFEQFEAMLRKGSPASRVSQIVFETCETLFSGVFEIR